MLQRTDEVNIKKLLLGQFSTNCYIVACSRTGAAVIIDAPAEAERILAEATGLGVQYILITHSHMDHWGALEELKARLRVPVGINPLDAARLPVAADFSLEDGGRVSFGTVSLGVIHTPGHSPGSVCFQVGKYLFSGDTIFPAGPGATRSPENFRQIVKSITEKLFPLPDDTVVHPGHGQDTILGKEKGEFAVFSGRPWNPQLCGDVLWLTS